MISRKSLYLPSGNSEYCAMPYGLSCTLSVFHYLINRIFQDKLSRFVIAYIKDIFIYIQSMETHVTHARQYQIQILVQGMKCKFHMSTIS